MFTDSSNHCKKTLLGVSKMPKIGVIGKKKSVNTSATFGVTLITSKVKTLRMFQFSSVAQSCPTLCDPMNRSTPGLPVHHQLPEFTQTHVHRVSDAIQPSYPLSSPSPPTPILPSIRVFSNESTLRMRWPKYWSFSFSIILSKEIPGLISFRTDSVYHFIVCCHICYSEDSGKWYYFCLVKEEAQKI